MSLSEVLIFVDRFSIRLLTNPVVWKRHYRGEKGGMVRGSGVTCDTQSLSTWVGFGKRVIDPRVMVGTSDLRQVQGKSIFF